MRAVDWWGFVRSAARAIEPMGRELATLMDADAACVPWYTSGGGGAVRSGVSDPTADMAMRRDAELSRQIADKRAQLDELESIVGHALALLPEIVSHVSGRAALVMELYYVDVAPTWSDVAAEVGVSRETVRADCHAVMDWMDARPRLMEIP